MSETSAAWPSFLMAAVAGAILALAFPPFGWWPLVVVGPALWLAAIRRSASGRQAALTGVAFGTTFMVALMWWLVNLRIEALIALAIAEVGFFVAFAVLVYAGRRTAGWRWVALVAGGWAAMEFIRARFPVGGLEWGGLGYAAGEWELLRDGAGIIGTTGWGVVFAALAALVVSQASWLRIGIAVVGVGVIAVGLAVAGSDPSGPELRVAIVQGNTPCPEHCVGERQGIFASHLDLTRGLVPGEHDLVVWAESATTFDPGEESEQRDLIAAEAIRLGAHIIVGGDRPGSATTFINSNVIFEPDGSIQTEVRKAHPVPFGEYVPLRSVFGRLAITAQVPRDLIPAERTNVAVIGDVPVGTVISFDGSFARYARDSVAAGAQILVVASNEASYGVSPASQQFIGLTRMRSAELGIDVVHAAITGSSTLITERGDVGPATPLYEATVIKGIVRPRLSGPTLYARWGDWLAVTAMASAAAVVVWEAMVSLADRPIRSLRRAS